MSDRDIRADLVAHFEDPDLEFLNDSMGEGTRYDAAIIGVTDHQEALAERDDRWSESALTTQGLLEIGGGARSHIVVMGLEPMGLTDGET